MAKIMKSYQFAFKPTAAQRQQLAVEFGNARFVWNRCLEWRTREWQEHQVSFNYVALSKQVTEWKNGEFPWLKDSVANCLTQVLIDQDKAFQNFFRRVKNGEKPGYPQFKSRYDRQSVRYQLDQRNIDRTYRAGEFLQLPKLGRIKVRWSQVPGGTPKMATISKTPDGRYFVSFMCEVEIQSLPTTGHTIGVDLGIKDVVVTSEGFKSGNPKHLKRRLKHLKRQQRRLARRQKGSNRRRRQKACVARIHRRIANSRQDFLHKTTTALIRQADVIAIEDLNVRGMMKNHHLAGAIADVGMGEFRRQLAYKAGWYGRQVVTAHRFAPTSKTCSECQVVQPAMTLQVRQWTCPECGAKHDRDVNAAINILKFSTLGNRGMNVRGQSKNLPTSVGTLIEAQTESKNSSLPTVGNGRQR